MLRIVLGNEKTYQFNTPKCQHNCYHFKCIVHVITLASVVLFVKWLECRHLNATRMEYVSDY